MATGTKLSNLIAPHFHPTYVDILKSGHTEYWLKGGRSSTKSSFISLVIALGIMRDKDANAVVFMALDKYIGTSVWEQFRWAIYALGVEEYWAGLRSPYKWIYKPTGQTIFFRGLDDASKTKSIKVAVGYFKYIWFEELDAFTDMAEIRKALQSLYRKSDGNLPTNFATFYSYNPPRQKNNWVNIEAKVIKQSRLVDHSTYLDVPIKWLTKEFLQEAEHLKATDPLAYEHEYLGAETGCEGAVYPMFNRKAHIIDKLEKNELVHTCYVGGDGGTTRDSTTLVPLMLTTLGRVVVAPTFKYDPMLVGNQPLAPSVQVAWMDYYLDVLIATYGIPSDKLVVVMDSAASDLTLEFNKAGRHRALSVPKKDVLLDMGRVRGMLSYPGYFAIINKGYINPLTNGVVTSDGFYLGDDDPLITELENLVIDPKTNKPMDGFDHSIDALKYGSYFVYKGGDF